jgi:deferrochelatase/peroxidase EfeB
VERDLLDDQQKVIGRFKYLGAPLTSWADHDTSDFAIKGATGGIGVIPQTERHDRRPGVPASRPPSPSSSNPGRAW